MHLKTQLRLIPFRKQNLQSFRQKFSSKERRKYLVLGLSQVLHVTAMYVVLVREETLTPSTLASS